jgi:hypothetical protein
LPIQKGSDKTETAETIKQLFGVPQDALADFHKPAGLKCPHQHFGGCRVYEKRPMGCRLWSCRWLVGDDTAELRRPDRVGYVIDLAPDYIVIDANGESTKIAVVQIWIDPKRKDDWRQDDELWKFMARRGYENMATILRFNSYDAKIIFPPVMSDDHQWHEVDDTKVNVVRERR